jgi:hypothetical protein
VHVCRVSCVRYLGRVFPGVNKASNCTTGRREDSRLLTGPVQAHNFCEPEFSGGHQKQ